MAKFKVGDIVKYIEPKIFKSDPEEGSICTITRIQDDHVSVDGDLDGDPWWQGEDEFELVEDNHDGWEVP